MRIEGRRSAPDAGGVVEGEEADTDRTSAREGRGGIEGQRVTLEGRRRIGSLDVEERTRGEGEVINRQGAQGGTWIDHCPTLRGQRIERTQTRYRSARGDSDSTTDGARVDITTRARNRGGDATRRGGDRTGAEGASRDGAGIRDRGARGGEVGNGARVGDRTGVGGHRAGERACVRDGTRGQGRGSSDDCAGLEFQGATRDANRTTSGQAAGRGDVKETRRDGGRTRVGIGTRKDPLARARLHERDGARVVIVYVGDDWREGVRADIRAGQGQRPVAAKLVDRRTGGDGRRVHRGDGGIDRRAQVHADREAGVRREGRNISSGGDARAADGLADREARRVGGGDDLLTGGAARRRHGNWSNDWRAREVEGGRRNRPGGV